MLRAGQILGELDVFRRICAEVVHGHIPLAISQCCLNRVRQARDHTEAIVFRFRGIDHQAVNNGFDRVFLVSVDVDLFVEIEHQPIHSHPRETALADLIKQGLVGAFTLPYHRRQHEQPGTDRQVHDRFDDLLRGLFLYRTPANRAMRHSDPREKQAEVVVNLGDRADCGTRVVGSGFLVNRNRG